MSLKRFKFLLTKYLNDTLNFREKTEFFDLVEKGKYDHEIAADFKSSFYEEGIKDSGENLTGSEHAGKIDKEEIGKIILLRRRKLIRTLLQSAAAVLVFVYIGLYVYFSTKHDDKAAAFFTAFIKTNQQAVKNNTTNAMAVLLPDSSIITLQPASSLYYSSSNFSSKREVYMEGKALFNITKNAKSPFYVYYKDVVTKVLGTSFNIYTSAKTGNTEVEVLTGKVQVYPNEKILVANKKANEIVIVTPNQKAVYEPVKHTFSATLVDEPKLLLSKEKATANIQQPSANFNFNNTKMAAVIDNIELNYGIKINVSDDKIYGYEFSGDITSQGLFDKLKIISIATNTRYEVNGTSITISALNNVAR